LVSNVIAPAEFAAGRLIEGKGDGAPALAGVAENVLTVLTSVLIGNVLMLSI
jgi:hypothetical protein